MTKKPLMKTLAYSFLLSVLSLQAWSQNGWNLKSIGINYEFDLSSDKRIDVEPGLRGIYSYSVEKPTLSFTLQNKRLLLMSAAGASIYKLHADYLSIGGITEAEVSSVNLVLSQKIGYDLIRFHVNDSEFFDPDPLKSPNRQRTYLTIPFTFRLIPFVGIEYDQPIKTMDNHRGFENLHHSEATEWIEKHKLAALKTDAEKSSAFLWANIGAGIEVTFFKKIGLFYEFTYHMKMVGTYNLSIHHRYLDKDIKTNTFGFDSHYAGHTMGVRYHF